MKQPIYKAKSTEHGCVVYGVPMGGVMLNGIIECNNQYVTIEQWDPIDESTLILIEEDSDEYGYLSRIGIVKQN